MLGWWTPSQHNDTSLNTSSFASKLRQTAQTQLEVRTCYVGVKDWRLAGMSSMCSILECSQWACMSVPFG